MDDKILIVLLGILITNVLMNIGIYVIIKDIRQYLASIEHYTTLLWLNKKSKIKKRKGIIKFDKLTELPRDF